jgi:hypothetical protein
MAQLHHTHTATFTCLQTASVLTKICYNNKKHDFKQKGLKSCFEMNRHYHSLNITSKQHQTGLSFNGDVSNFLHLQPKKWHGLAQMGFQELV